MSKNCRYYHSFTSRVKNYGFYFRTILRDTKNQFHTILIIIWNYGLLLVNEARDTRKQSKTSLPLLSSLLPIRKVWWIKLNAQFSHITWTNTEHKQKLFCSLLSEAVDKHYLSIILSYFVDGNTKYYPKTMLDSSQALWRGFHLLYYMEGHKRCNWTRWFSGIEPCI